MIGQTVPADVYLDTSVVVGAQFAGTPHSEACRAFCDRLAEHGSHVYFSQVLRFEIANVLRRLATKVDKLPLDIRQHYQLDRWDDDFMVRQRWLTDGANQFDAFLQQFEEVVEIPLRPPLWRQSFMIMALDRLRPGDAIHLATARAIRVRDFATTDHDFRSIREPRIHIVRDPLP